MPELGGTVPATTAPNTVTGWPCSTVEDDTDAVTEIATECRHEAGLLFCGCDGSDCDEVSRVVVGIDVAERAAWQPLDAAIDIVRERREARPFAKRRGDGAKTDLVDDRVCCVDQADAAVIGDAGRIAEIRRNAAAVGRRGVVRDQVEAARIDRGSCRKRGARGNGRRLVVVRGAQHPAADINRCRAGVEQLDELVVDAVRSTESELADDDAACRLREVRSCNGANTVSARTAADASSQFRDLIASLVFTPQIVREGQIRNVEKAMPTIVCSRSR